MSSLNIWKREIRYWNFDNRTCLARINNKTNLPTEVAGVHSVCYMLNMDIFIMLYQVCVIMSMFVFI